MNSEHYAQKVKNCFFLKKLFSFFRNWTFLKMSKSKNFKKVCEKMKKSL